MQKGDEYALSVDWRCHRCLATFNVTWGAISHRCTDKTDEENECPHCNSRGMVSIENISDNRTSVGLC